MEDRKVICPCDRHQEDIAQDGHCICHLFVDDRYVPEDLDAPPLLDAEGDWPEIIVYGASWCSHTRGTRLLLNERGVPYRYVDVDQNDDAARLVEEWNNGYRSTPTLMIGDQIVPEPTDQELLDILGLEPAAS